MLRVIIAILTGLLALPPLAFAGGNYRQALTGLPDWEIRLDDRHKLRPNIDKAGLGDGSFASGRNSVAYGWVPESVVVSESVTAANSRCSFEDNQSWLWFAGKNYGIYADTGHRIQLIDDAGLRASATCGSVGEGETWANDVITDGDFPNFNNWAESGTWAINAGKARVTGNGANNQIQQDSLAVTVGKVYKVTFTTSSSTDIEDNQFRCYRPMGIAVTPYTDDAGTQLKVDGEHIIIRTAVDNGTYTTTIRLRLNSSAPDGTLDIDDVSQEELTDCSNQGLHTYKISDPTQEGWDYDASFDFNNIEHVIISQEDSSGNLLVWYPTNMQRHEKVGGYWAELGEPAGTNKILWCRDIDNASASWTLFGTGSGAQNATGIDGVTNTATTITDSDGANVSSMHQEIAKATSATTPYCLSVHVDKTTGATNFPGIGIRFKDVADKYAIYVINTNTGAITAYSGNDAANINGGIRDKGDFYLVWVVAEDNGANSTVQSLLYPAINADASANPNAAITGSYIFDWAQLELDKKFPSNPKYTEGSETTQATEGGGYPRWGLPEDMAGTGCMLGESLGAELVTGGDCSTDNFSEGTGWVYNAGTDKYDATAANGNLSQDFATEAGAIYKVSVTITRTAGTLYVDLGSDGDNRGMMIADGTYTFRILRTGTSLDRIRFYGGSFSGTIDDISARKVTNSWNSLPPHFSMRGWFRPGFDHGDMAAGNYGLLSTDGNAQSGPYLNENGELCVYDGTTECKVDVNGSKDTWYRWFWKAGYLSSNVSKQRVGYATATGSSITWGTAVDYDGDYPTGANLESNVGLTGPMHQMKTEGWRRILSDSELLFN